MTVWSGRFLFVSQYEVGPGGAFMGRLPLRLGMRLRFLSPFSCTIWFGLAFNLLPLGENDPEREYTWRIPAVLTARDQR